MAGVVDRVRLRTIPTRVGRTTFFPDTASQRADHPHAGGENHQPAVESFVQFGPSPRGWGEQFHLGLAVRDLRTIPTRVGRTSPPPHSACLASDHPHAGGENPVMPAQSTIAAGPSPRGWGEHPVMPAAEIEPRTIPTRVGRTRVALAIPRLNADHPHAGGENPELPTTYDCALSRFWRSDKGMS